jgi:hypothetical protein
MREIMLRRVVEKSGAGVRYIRNGWPGVCGGRFWFLATLHKEPMLLKNSFLRRVQKVFWPVRCVEGLACRGIAPKAKVFRTAFSAKPCVGIAANMDAEGIQREFIVSAIYEFFNNIDPF